MDDHERDYIDANEISAIEDPATITLTLRVAGERQIEVDRDEYEAAKAAGRVDHYLDHDLSDLDGENTVIEPDGRSYNPHEQPHGPADDGDLEDAAARDDDGDELPAMPHGLDPGQVC